MTEAHVAPYYPSYVDFDRFLDVESLKSLDAFIREQIERHIQQQKDSYFLNLHRLEETAPYEPGVREIWLTRTVPGRAYDYLDLDQPELWQPSADAADFEPVMRFVETLPFAATGRILIIYDNSGHPVPAHRDHLEPEICNEFIWMRTNFNKRFYVLNAQSGEKLYVTSHSAWFDTVNQYHGADGSNGLSFSIRVDGRFADELRAQIPYPPLGRAAAPSLWAMSCEE